MAALAVAALAVAALVVADALTEAPEEVAPEPFQLLRGALLTGRYREQQSSSMPTGITSRILVSPVVPLISMGFIR